MSGTSEVLAVAEGARQAAERVARIGALREAYEIAEDAHKRARAGEPAAVAYDIAMAIHRKVMEA